MEWKTGVKQFRTSRVSCSEKRGDPEKGKTGKTTEDWGRRCTKKRGVQANTPGYRTRVSSGGVALQ